MESARSMRFLFLLQDRKQPDVCDHYFHDVPFEARFASDVPELQSISTMPGVDGFTMKVDALYKVSGNISKREFLNFALQPFA